MHVYLFLYPIDEYFLDLILTRGRPCPGGESIKQLNREIDQRFRESGAQICWVFHSSVHDLEVPDRKRASEHIVIQPEDQLLAAGVTFEMMNYLRFPAPSEFIVSQLPECDRLTIGGFHKHRCVKLLAIESIARGLPAEIDDATTDDFFLR